MKNDVLKVFSTVVLLSASCGGLRRVSDDRVFERKTDTADEVSFADVSMWVDTLTRFAGDETEVPFHVSCLREHDDSPLLFLLL